jgi:hypothetical protein
MSSPHISAFKRLGIFTSEAKIARSTVTVHIVQLLGLETMVHGIGPLMLEKNRSAVPEIMNLLHITNA